MLTSTPTPTARRPGTGTPAFAQDMEWHAVEVITAEGVFRLRFAPGLAYFFSFFCPFFFCGFFLIAFLSMSLTPSRCSFTGIVR